MSSYDDSEILRFWKYVEKSETCWLWTGAMIKGYGVLHMRGTRIYAHRFSWQLHVGSIPGKLFVLHDCPGGDNPSCVNPTHLWLGTHRDNMCDMIQKNRQWFQRHPERLKRGDEHHGRLHPENLARGDSHYARTNPERLSRGDSHYARTHPERLARGENHWAKRHPESVRRGAQHSQAKLTEEVVREARQRFQDAGGKRGMHALLAREYGVTCANMSMVLRGKTWTHILD